MLEEKAKLYESLSKDRGLLDEDTISEEQSFYLVNFQQKVVEGLVKERRAQSNKRPAPSKAPSSSSSDDDEAEEEADYPASNPDEEWYAIFSLKICKSAPNFTKPFNSKNRVDYVDGFGRTRRCLRKDLPSFKQADAELKKTGSVSNSTSSASYSNFVKPSESASANADEASSSSTLAQDEEARRLRREKWEQEAEENARKSKLHYQDVLYQGKLSIFGRQSNTLGAKQKNRQKVIAFC